MSHTTSAARSAFGADPLLIFSAVAALAIVSGCAVAIAKLLDDVMGGDDAARVDPTILRWFIDHRTELLTTWAKWFTHLGDPAVVAAVVAGCVIALAVRGRGRLALFVVASSAGAAVATTAAKYAVDRTRPPEALWLAPAYGPAFPSGHATQSVACYLAIAVVGVIMLRAPAARVAVVVAAGSVALLVGMSRIYLGVHWPSDVLCGWAVAMMWLVALLLVGWFRPRLAALWSTRSVGGLQPAGSTGADRADRQTNGTFTGLRKLLIVPLLDEPLSALDLAVRVELRTLVRRVVEESGMPASFVTHDLAEADELADVLISYDHGTVVSAEQRGRPAPRGPRGAAG